MSSPESADRQGHLLSKKSRKLCRDTFFFWNHSLPGWLIGGEVVMFVEEVATDAVLEFSGLNQRVTPINSAKLHRWIRIVDPEALNFELQPTTLRKFGVLTYYKMPAGETIPAESTAPLSTGDYCWNVVAQFPSEQFRNFDEELTFAEKKVRGENPDPEDAVKKLLHWYNFPSPLEPSVKQRDRGRCLITGFPSHDVKVCVSWIFPPAWASWLDQPYWKEYEKIREPSNAMLMRKDLMDAFHDNAFGIDVDDNYRLIMFRDFVVDNSSAQELLTGFNSQAYFRRPQVSAQLTGPDDYFLREHFKHCLRVHLLGGDIRVDYPANLVEQEMQDLGVIGRGNELLPFDNPRWSTELGREIFLDFMDSQVHASDPESEVEVKVEAAADGMR